jgi:hypothetical protein
MHRGSQADTENGKVRMRNRRRCGGVGSRDETARSRRSQNRRSATGVVVIARVGYTTQDNAIWSGTDLVAP